MNKIRLIPTHSWTGPAVMHAPGQGLANRVGHEDQPRPTEIRVLSITNSGLELPSGGDYLVYDSDAEDGR